MQSALEKIQRRRLSMQESALSDAPDDFVANPIWNRFSQAGSRPMVKIPSDVILDADNQLGGFGNSSIAPVNGVYTIPVGATLQLQVGGNGYRPAIFRRLVLDSASADFASCTVNFQAASTSKNYQIGTFNNFPARAFAPGSFSPPELHVAINSTVSTTVSITNGGAAPVNLTAGVIIC